MIEPVRKQKRQKQLLSYNGFPRGLNTSVPSGMITNEELAEVVDWKYNSRGQLESRDAICLYTTSACSSGVKTIGSAIIGGTDRVLMCDASDNIYYLNGKVPTYIDQAEGESQFLGYNDKCLVLDGSYIKYLDDVSGLKIAYDTSETFFDEYSSTTSGTTTISTAGVGCTFTTPAWDAGYTIPPTTVTAKVKETTSGTGTISLVIRDVVASSDASTTAYPYDISSTLDFIDITISASDITAELKPSTQYYCLLKGSNVDLAYHTVSTGGAMITGGSTPDTTKDPIMRINPGRPPKGAFGCLSDRRPWIWGDPDSPGSAHYGKLSTFEWGTLHSVDEDATSYPIGGMEDLYGDLRVYGKQEQPYLAVLTGDTESAWTIKKTFQEIWTLPKTLVNVGNDLWCSNSNNTYPLRGVQEYGDVRFSPAANNIRDKFVDNWVDTSFATYYPNDSQYWLYMPGYSNIMICHTKQEFNPWTEYTPPVTPTCFKNTTDYFFMGSSDGNLYTLDSSEYKDLGTTQIEPKFKTSYIELPINDVNLSYIQFVAQSLTGSNFQLSLYINGNHVTPKHVYTNLLPASDGLTVDQLIMDVDDMDFSLDPSSTPLKLALNVNCWSVQIGIDAVKISGYPVYFSGFFLRYSQLEV